MQAELQFLMSPTDTQDFLTFVADHVDAIEACKHKGDAAETTVFYIGDCEIIFSPSKQLGITLMIGSIAINSGGIDDGCEDKVRANKSYRELRGWLKKYYYSRLCSWADGSEEKSFRTRDYWLGPDAKKWHTETPGAVMRLSDKSNMLIGIAPEFNTMGEITPKIKKKK